MSSVLPGIILYKPQMGENIGFCARVMANFGFRDLRLVLPRDGWPNEAAVPISAGALPDRVEVGVFSDLGSAVADLCYVLAATARERTLSQPVYDAARGVEAMRGKAGGILFGPENSGLPNEAVAFASAILRFPVADDFPSLNLGHAVALCCHQWAALSADPLPPAVVPGRMDELAAMLEQLETALTERGYFYPPQRSAIMRNKLRSVFSRAGWSSGEIGAFRGMITALTRAKNT